MVADAIVEHIRLCNWKIERGPPWEGFAYLAGERDVERGETCAGGRGSASRSL
jgi:hypothetical protein